MLKEIPKFTDYFCYMFFMGTIMVGPCLEFRTFNDWIYLQGKFEAIPQWGQLKTLLIRFCTGLLTIATFIALSSYFSFNYMKTEEFANDPRGFLYRSFYLCACIQMYWESYFTGFCLMDCALIACGIGYSPKTETQEETYNAISSVNIISLDKAYTVSQLMSNWNIQVHNWLKYYVMLRWIDKSKPKHIVQPFPIFMSFAMSLIWHGFWPGYFLTFFGAAILDILGKNISRTKVAN